MQRVVTRTGARVPVLGQGTWRMGESAARERDEIAAIRLGIDLGLTLIDTAEMYGEGGAEEVVGRAITGRRDDVYLVSKVYPHNGSRHGVIEAAERSLERLGTDRIDLYLLHWPGSHPIEGTLAAFEELRAAGKVIDYGVSNFDVGEMEEAVAAPHGDRVAVNQILYNPTRRGVERNLLPRCADLDVVVMAYSPLEQGRLPTGGALERVAVRHGASPAQVVLAWTLRREGLVTIVKSVELDHVRANADAARIELTTADLDEIDAEFPVPDHDTPLECL